MELPKYLYYVKGVGFTDYKPEDITYNTYKVNKFRNIHIKGNLYNVDKEEDTLEYVGKFHNGKPLNNVGNELSKALENNIFELTSSINSDVELYNLIVSIYGNKFAPESYMNFFDEGMEDYWLGFNELLSQYIITKNIHLFMLKFYDGRKIYKYQNANDYQLKCDYKYINSAFMTNFEKSPDGDEYYNITKNYDQLESDQLECIFYNYYSSIKNYLDNSESILKIPIQLYNYINYDAFFYLFIQMIYMNYHNEHSIRLDGFNLYVSLEKKPKYLKITLKTVDDIEINKNYINTLRKFIGNILLSSSNINFYRNIFIKMTPYDFLSYDEYHENLEKASIEAEKTIPDNDNVVVIGIKYEDHDTYEEKVLILFKLLALSMSEIYMPIFY